jgi:hypothetical protein
MKRTTTEELDRIEAAAGKSRRALRYHVNAVRDAADYYGFQVGVVFMAKEAASRLRAGESVDDVLACLDQEARDRSGQS